VYTYRINDENQQEHATHDKIWRPYCI